MTDEMSTAMRLYMTATHEFFSAVSREYGRAMPDDLDAYTKLMRAGRAIPYLMIRMSVPYSIHCGFMIGDKPCPIFDTGQAAVDHSKLN